MLEFAVSTNFVPKVTVSGVFFTSTSATVYLNWYSCSLPDASFTSTFPIWSPKVAFEVAVISFPVIWTFPFGVSVFLTNSLPLGRPEALNSVTFPELSLTVKVGLKVAPRKITNLLFSFLASLDNSLPLNDTFGFSLSFIVTVTILDDLYWVATGPSSAVFGNVTFT